MNYREQHKKRLEWMPWLFFSLKPKHQEWAWAWQKEVQEELSQLETIEFNFPCFIAPSAKIFAEPGRKIIVGEGCFIGAESFIHGPVTMGKNIGINPRVVIDGGKKGVFIGDDTRVAQFVKIYAFNHGLDPKGTMRGQSVSSEGICIGKDVWIGSGAGIVDGVCIEDHAVVGMSAVVTKSIKTGDIVAGNPARVIGNRKNKDRGSVCLDALKNGLEN